MNREEYLWKVEKVYPQREHETLSIQLFSTTDEPANELLVATRIIDAE